MVSVSVENESIDWFPTHAYIPGKTARHPEGYFDEFKVNLEYFSTERLNESLAWKLGLNLLRNEYFWEAHELFECIWMACTPNSAEKYFVQALIQCANSGLKHKMELETAADKLNEEANRLVKEAFLRTQTRIFGYSKCDWPIA